MPLQYVAPSAWTREFYPDTPSDGFESALLASRTAYELDDPALTCVADREVQRAFGIGQRGTLVIG